MRNPLYFFVELLKQPLWVQIWVTILSIVNIASIFYINHSIGLIILITFLLIVVIMLGLFSYFGFEKILGLGHMPWLILVPYVLMHASEAQGSLQLYLVALVSINSISLLFDIYDVIHYQRNRI